MPYIPMGGSKALFTTAENPDSDDFGTIISKERKYTPAPWIKGVAENPLNIWYWVKEAKG